MTLSRSFLAAAAAVTLTFSAAAAHAFCGFYVAKADTDLFNKASKVVLARHDGKTVITMASDYQGDAEDFALVVPVPTFLEEGQIHVTENKYIDHLDAYTAPRLVEYFDEDPCAARYYERDMMTMAAPKAAMMGNNAKQDAAALGVTIEASYTVGEYDILILSAEQSDGLVTWLKQNDYKIPDGAEPVIDSYLKQDMRFFVAKVNLSEQRKLGYSYLRPIQVAYESHKFMLPIRLGTVNADGPQELFIFSLTQKGRIETTNYRTTKIPSDDNIPLFVKDEFGDFYTAMFDRQVEKESMKTVFLEYAWDMGWCDPCAADPLSSEELRELGVFWTERQTSNPPGVINFRAPQSQAQDVFVTRLHLRYDRDHFPEDLLFQETSDRNNFQGRYVLQHPWTGSASCDAGRRYKASLPERFSNEAQTLARLTGWDINKIRRKMDDGGQPFNGPPEPGKDKKWWQRLWN